MNDKTNTNQATTEYDQSLSACEIVTKSQLDTSELQFSPLDNKKTRFKMFQCVEKARKALITDTEYIMSMENFYDD